MQVADTVAMVTGGGGGLGAGVVRMLAAGGARVGVVDLPRTPGAEVLAREWGDRVVLLPADITDPAQVDAAVSGLREAFGRLDVLVNAAGVAPVGRVLDRHGDPTDLAGFRRTLDINVSGSFDVVRSAAAAMARNEPGPDGERGLIVQVSSIAALDGAGGRVAYTWSKGAVAAGVLALARDLARWGIRVMGIAPGVMDTPMVGTIPADKRAELTDQALFPKRLGTPEDFAALVRTCMEITLLNGEMIRLDAGARLS